MTLTVVVGASGSGKTTFLNDVHKSHQCVYIRQYHNLRPYITVSVIPNFDPSELPYWETYVREKKDTSIIVGGTIGGHFMAGLSGGQRKLLVFELIFQRTENQENILIVLDEPFAGVTDDFVPFIDSRLKLMSKKHNIVLVTNDHVDKLKAMADNIITVSAIDRSKVQINKKEGVDRPMALMALSMGDGYKNSTKEKDVAFFRRVELSKKGGIPSVAAFTVFSYALFLLMFWDSKPGSEALIVVAACEVSYFIVYPYLLQLADWRVFMVEEAEALLHSSKSVNKLLKSILAVSIVVAVTCIQFGCQYAVIESMLSAGFFFGILFDNLSSVIALITFALYTELSDQTIQVLGLMPFMFMIFFSTTFSPGAGVEGLKNLRYLFPRFYLWCMLPPEMGMDGCPEGNNLLYLIVVSLLLPLVFVLWKLASGLYTKVRTKKLRLSRRLSMESIEFAELQVELYGEKVLKRLQHLSSRDMMRLSTMHSSSDNDSTSSGHLEFDQDHQLEEIFLNKDDDQHLYHSLSEKGTTTPTSTPPHTFTPLSTLSSTTTPGNITTEKKTTVVEVVVQGENHV